MGLEAAQRRPFLPSGTQIGVRADRRIRDRDARGHTTSLMRLRAPDSGRRSPRRRSADRGHTSRRRPGEPTSRPPSRPMPTMRRSVRSRASVRASLGTDDGVEGDLDGLLVGDIGELMTDADQVEAGDRCATATRKSSTCGSGAPRRPPRRASGGWRRRRASGVRRPPGFAGRIRRCRRGSRWPQVPTAEVGSEATASERPERVAPPAARRGEVNALHAVAQRTRDIAEREQATVGRLTPANHPSITGSRWRWMAARREIPSVSASDAGEALRVAEAERSQQSRAASGETGRRRHRNRATARGGAGDRTATRGAGALRGLGSPRLLGPR